MKVFHKTFLGDCLDIMKTIEPESIDLILTDPPYNVSKTTIKFKDRKDISSDFGYWDSFNSNNDFIEFAKKWVELAVKLLKPDGSILVFSKLDDIGNIKRIYESFGVYYKSTVIWHKTNPVPQIRKVNFLSSCEAINWGIKDYTKKEKRFTFNFKTQKEMHNFIETPLCMGKERTAHPTQKPEKLIAHFIEIFSNPNDVILDPFAGSGTVAAVAMRLGRKSISIEKDKAYYKIMQDRLHLLKRS
jgi:site-specific DNA-methyltransferase (adenine-specific)/modification methylase